MKSNLTALVVVLVFAGATSQALAHDETTPEIVASNMTARFLHGIVTVATCPGEIPKQIHNSTAEQPVAQGIVVGLLKGSGLTVYRAIGGTLETCFFFVPDLFPELFPEADYVWKGWHKHTEGTDAASAPETADE